MKIFSKSKTSEPEIKAIDEPVVEPEVAPETPAEEEAPSELETLKAELMDAIKMAKDEILEAIKAATEEEVIEPTEPEVAPEEQEAAKAEKAKEIATAAINIVGEAGFAPIELKEANSSAKPEVSRADFDAMDHMARNSFIAQGGKIK